jgi:multicomponent Na+:H+ antiporter subunit D
VPYAVLLIAQAVTVAALARALFAMFRTRDGDYERDEPLRAGTRTALAVLGTGCVAFGVFAGPILHRAMAPAAAALLDGTAYAHAALHGGGAVAPVSVHFTYLSARELVGTALAVVAAWPIAVWARRHGEATAVKRFRALASGSVNDYAAYLTIGLLGVAALFLGTVLS